MTKVVEEFFSAALALPAEDRAALADRLLESLNRPTQAEIDAAWASEAERRIDEADRGEGGESIPGDEFVAKMRARVK